MSCDGEPKNLSTRLRRTSGGRSVTIGFSPVRSHSWGVWQTGGPTWQSSPSSQVGEMGHPFTPTVAFASVLGHLSVRSGTPSPSRSGHPVHVTLEPLRVPGHRSSRILDPVSVPIAPTLCLGDSQRAILELAARDMTTRAVTPSALRATGLDAGIEVEIESAVDAVGGRRRWPGWWPVVPPELRPRSLRPGPYVGTTRARPDQREEAAECHRERAVTGRDHGILLWRMVPGMKGSTRTLGTSSCVKAQPLAPIG